MLFTKPARAGDVKTRMAPHYALTEASELHQALLNDVVSQLVDGNECGSGGASTCRGECYGLHVAWALREGQRLPTEIFGCPDLAIETFFEQQGCDLGERLFLGLSRVRDAGARKVAAVGSDHPEVDASLMRRVFAALDAHDVAVVPATDGGYCVLGLRADCLCRDIFDRIPWSTAGVLEANRSRVQSLGMSLIELEPACDVDTAEDLDALMRRLANDENQDLARHTRAWYREKGRPVS